MKAHKVSPSPFLPPFPLPPLTSFFQFVCNRAWFGPSADSADQKRQSQEKPPGYLGKISDTMETIREVLMAERVMTEEEIAMQMYLLEQEDGEVCDGMGEFALL